MQSSYRGSTCTVAKLRGPQEGIKGALRRLYLLLRGRTELLGLLGGDSGGHVEGLHELVVSELLVELQLGYEAV